MRILRVMNVLQKMETPVSSGTGMLVPAVSPEVVVFGCDKMT